MPVPEPTPAEPRAGRWPGPGQISLTPLPAQGERVLPPGGWLVRDADGATVLLTHPGALTLTAAVTSWQANMSGHAAYYSHGDAPHVARFCRLEDAAVFLVVACANPGARLHAEGLTPEPGTDYTDRGHALCLAAGCPARDPDEPAGAAGSG